MKQKRFYLSLKSVLMLDDDFCQFLEFALSKAFNSSMNESLRNFWCDGVLLPYNEDKYTQKWVNDKRTVVLTALTGVTGQEKYELVLQFGPKTLSRYARNLRIEDCLQGIECLDWLQVDVVQKKLIIQLN